MKRTSGAKPTLDFFRSPLQSIQRLTAQHFIVRLSARLSQLYSFRLCQPRSMPRGTSCNRRRNRHSQAPPPRRPGPATRISRGAGRSQVNPRIARSSSQRELPQCISQRTNGDNLSVPRRNLSRNRTVARPLKVGKAVVRKRRNNLAGELRAVNQERAFSRG